jgi:hypothetical protein
MENIFKLSLHIRARFIVMKLMIDAIKSILFNYVDL